MRSLNPPTRAAVAFAGALVAGGVVFFGLRRAPAPDPPPSLPHAAANGVAAPKDELAVDLERRLTHDVAPILGQFCLSCHKGEDAKAGLELDGLTDLKAALAGFDIRMIKEMVGSASMPPKDKPQPTEHQRLAIAQWADDVLGYVPADAPIDPGWFTIHRLNRTEYRNTLRDLLGIDPASVDVAANLPRDDTGYGFDNVADVLSTSPLAIEAYLAAAEKAIETALGPIVEVGDTPRGLRPIEGSSGQPLPNGGFFLYSNGPATGTFIAPVTGDYLVRARVWETKAGDDHARAGLSIGGKQVEEFLIKGTKNKPQTIERRVRIEKGTLAISVAFLNDYYVKDKADRNMGVDSISVAGPLDEASIERPAKWKRLMDSSSAGLDDDARAASTLTEFATSAYRRPISTAQTEALLKVYRAHRDTGAAYEPALRTALTAVIVSPNFLFRAVAHPDAANPRARHTLDGYELASRLSYFLWSSMPDVPLLDAAADGSLLTDDGLKSHVKRMLADSRSSSFVENFAGQWLQLRGLAAVAIDTGRFPDFDDAMRKDLIAEATLFLGDVLRSDRSVLEFIDSRETFLNARLAKFYGVPEVQGDELRRVALPASSPRGGVLTMGAILALTSNTTRTSPVKRGLFVLDQMLGAPPPPPPADIPPLEQAVATNPDATVRERLAAHVADPSCAACHRRLDPLGLAFENFDAIGHWRDNEHGSAIDATGTLPDGTALNGSADLKRVLMGRSDQFVEALCARTLTYALGRGVEPFDRPAVRQIAKRTRANGDRFSAIIESIVLSDTFRTCRGRESKR